MTIENNSTPAKKGPPSYPIEIEMTQEDSREESGRSECSGLLSSIDGGSPPPPVSEHTITLNDIVNDSERNSILNSEIMMRGGGSDISGNSDHNKSNHDNLSAGIISTSDNINSGEFVASGFKGED